MLAKNARAPRACWMPVLSLTFFASKLAPTEGPVVRIALFLCAWLVCLGARAASVDVASLDRGTWPEKLSSPALFDVASRAEILMFANTLLVSEALDEPALKQRLGLKIINQGLSMTCVATCGNGCWRTTRSPSKAASRTPRSATWWKTWTTCASRPASLKSATNPSI